MPESPSYYELMQDGALLSKGKARMLAQSLQAAPANLAIRAQLLGFHNEQQNRTGKTINEFVEHLIYFIRERPGDPLHQWTANIWNPTEFQLVRREWLKQVRAHSSDIQVLDNAAHFCKWQSHKDAIRLWLKAHSLDPGNNDFARELSDVYQQMFTHSGSKRHAQRSVEYLILAIDINQTDARPTYLTPYLEMIASNLGHALIDLQFPDLATKLGLKLIETATWRIIERRDDGSENVMIAHRGAPYHGHVMIARAMVAQGDISAARAELQKMIAFGQPESPDLYLARELFDHGERDSVCAYLRACIESFELRLRRCDDWDSNPDQIRMREAGFVTHLEEQRASLRRRIDVARSWISEIEKGRKNKGNFKWMEVSKTYLCCWRRDSSWASIITRIADGVKRSNMTSDYNKSRCWSYAGSRLMEPNRTCVTSRLLELFLR